MTLEEKLTELESRYVVVDGVRTEYIRKFVTRLIGTMTYGEIQRIPLRDQHMQTGVLTLEMTATGRIKFESTGRIEQSLTALRGD